MFLIKWSLCLNILCMNTPHILVLVIMDGNILDVAMIRRIVMLNVHAGNWWEGLMNEIGLIS